MTEDAPEGPNKAWCHSPIFWVRAAALPLEVLEGLAATSLTEARAKLDAALSRPEVRSALGVLAPEFGKRLAAGRPTAEAEQLEFDAEALYRLQRLAVDPQPAGSLSPLFWGRFGGAGSQPVRIETVGTSVAVRAVGTLDHKAVHTLARIISRDRAVWLELVPELSSACEREGRTLRFPVAKQTQLDDRQFAVLSRLDRAKTSRELLAELRQDAAFAGATEEQIERFFRDLVDRRVLYCELMVPAVVSDPGADLVAKLAALPERCAPRARWLSVLEQLGEAAKRLASTRDFGERSAILSEAQRLYAEATSNEVPEGTLALFHEEAERNIAAFELSAEVAARLQRLGPLLEISRWLVLELPRRYQERFLEVYKKLDLHGTGVDFVRFFRETSWIVQKEDVERELLGELREAWLEVLGERYAKGQPELVITADDCEAVRRRLTETYAVGEPLEAVGANFHSVDLAIEPSGRLVIADHHKGLLLLTQPIAQRACPFRQEVEAFIARHVPGPIYQLADSPLTYHRADVNWPDLPPFHEIVSEGMVSRFPQERVVPIGTLQVVEDDGNLWVRARKGELRVWFFSVVTAALHRKLAEMPLLPLETDHAPKVLYEDMVVQRRAWRVPASELPAASEEITREAFDRFGAAVEAFRRARGLPLRLSVKAPKEPRPVFVDIGTPTGLELFSRLAAAGNLVLTEPGLEAADARLSPGHNERCVYEVRLTFARS